MDVRNRMADIDKLRCNVCQDFLRLVIQPDWNQRLYVEAKKAVEENRGYKDKYRPIYEKMRDAGTDGYSIDDMDMTIMNALLHHGQGIVLCSRDTKLAMGTLTTDRNIESHSGENEKAGELYSQGLLALENLRKFVHAVDTYEKNIADKERLAYRQKYIAEIDRLKEVLFEEYNASVQRDKDMQEDIRAILDSDNRLTKWCSVHQKYVNSETTGCDLDGYYQFCVKASDAGISEAHGLAASYFMHTKDYEEVEKRLWMLYNASEKKPTREMKSVVDTIHEYQCCGNPLTEGMNKLITNMKEVCCPIGEKEGYVYWIQDRKQNDAGGTSQNNIPAKERATHNNGINNTGKRGKQAHGMLSVKDIINEIKKI